MERIRDAIVALLIITTAVMGVFFNSNGFAFEKASVVAVILMLAFAILEVIDMAQEQEENKKHHPN